MFPELELYAKNVMNVDYFLKLFPVLHYIVDFIILSFGIMGFIVEL